MDGCLKPRIMGKGRITSIDVARLANLSQSAVSRTFTPGASVSEETRRRVLEASKKLGYRPNAIASALITRRSKIIGVVMSYLENQFYPVVLEKLSRQLQSEGYHVLLFVPETSDADLVLEEILRYQVDAIVLASTMLSSPLARECAEAGVPVVYFNRISNLANCSSVTSDNLEGGRLVANFLADGGHKRIAYIAGLENSSTNRERERGLQEGLARRKLRCFARAVGYYNFEQAKQAAREIFGNGERPDAVFVANDHMAFAVMDTIRGEFGLKIPDDVSVVAFDNVPQAAWGAYDLTTVEQGVGPMVEAAVQLLREQLSKDASKRRNVIVPCRLIVRSSARRP